METLSTYRQRLVCHRRRLPVGRLVESASLVVTDTFGVRTLLQPAGPPDLGPLGLFRHAMPVETDEAEGFPISNLLYLAPRVAQPLIGPVVEQITLTRDEQANVGWAIEQSSNRPFRSASRLAIPGRRPARRPGCGAGYPLAHEPPPHWIPLLPVRTGPDEQVVLARGSVLDVSGGRRLVESVTALLAGDADGELLIPEEEVPDDGLVVQRHYQAARWIDGASTLGGLSHPLCRPVAVRPALRYDTIT